MAAQRRRAPATRRLGARLALLLGYASLGGCVLLAHASPATGYELSIYTATPIAFWAGVGAALVVGLAVGLASRDRVERLLASALGGGAMLAVTALPLLRGYTFYGTSDALTHLGLVRDVRAGHSLVTDIYYPGIHSISLLANELAGYPLTRSLLVAVLVFVVVYLVFVPASVTTLGDHPRAPVVGAFAALLLLPINHVAINYMNPHPISEAVLLSPLILYLLIRYLALPRTNDRVTGTGFLLAIALLATVFYHPMLAGLLISFIGAIAIAQSAIRRFGPDDAPAQGRPVHGHAAFLIVAFLLWNLRFSTFWRTLELTQLAIVETLAGRTGAGEVVASRSGSVASAGGSLLELFLKLFLPSAVFACLAVAVVGYGFLRWRAERYAVVRLLGAGLVGVGLYSLPLLAGDVSRLLFRHSGFVMAIATILGAVAIVFVLRDQGIGPAGVSMEASAAIAVGFAALLVLSTLVVFPSPYIYHANEQVNEGQYAGYEAAFEHRDPDVAFAGVRNGPQRYVQAVYGPLGSPDDLARFPFFRREGWIPSDAMADLSGHVDADRYLVVSALDRQRELEAYNGIRYTPEQLDAIDGQPGVSRVQSNGDVEVYYIANGSA